MGGALPDEFELPGATVDGKWRVASVTTASALAYTFGIGGAAAIVEGKP